jgi:cytochrome P450
MLPQISNLIEISSHETTSAALTWGSHLLAKHPDVQTRLRDEIRSNLPSPSTTSNSNIDIAAVLESLPYLTAVCNEILRLYPAVPITMRVAIRETAILTQQIPKGTKFYVSPWAINRSPLLWGCQAAEFVPERWIDPSTGKANNTGGVRSNYSNLTFLHGPRSCIGEKFAKTELKALIAVLVGTFEMEMADKDEVPIAGGAITAKPTNGMQLRLKGVDGW